MTIGKVGAVNELRAAVALGALLATLAPMSVSAATNRMRDLGTLGGSRAEASAINRAGQIVGYSDTAGDTERHAFIWQAARGMRDLGTLGGTSSAAVAINEAGQVVGYSYLAGDTEQHAFIWDEKGGMRDLGTLGGSSSSATAINGAGQVIGTSYTVSDKRQRAFLWTPTDGMRDLGTLGGEFSTAVAINDAGQVAGTAETALLVQHAFLWDPVKGMRDLGALGGKHSRPTAMNAAGQVVGYIELKPDVRHAFFWDLAKGMSDLGTLGGTSSAARAINDAGQVVGESHKAGDLEQHAFSWDPVTRRMRALGSLGGTTNAATAINTAGQVVGHGTLKGDAEDHALLWDAAGPVTDLGTLGGTSSRAIAINDAGRVIGNGSTVGNAADHPFLWQPPRELRDLGTLGGRDSAAMAINAAGRVVGQGNLTGDLEAHAFVWDAVGGMTDLGTFGGRFSSAVAINDAGQIAGWSTMAGDAEAHAFVWNAATGMRDLGAPGKTSSEAIAINGSGQVLGRSYSAGSNEEYAFVWDPVGGMRDLGALGGTRTVASAMNDAGQVVGSSYLAGDTEYHAFVWDAIGGMRDLGTLGGASSSALAINDAGQVAGFSWVKGDTTFHAFVWDAVHGMRDLGTLGGTSSMARDVNDAGQAVGYFDGGAAGQRAFVWDETGGMRDLGTPAGASAVAVAITEAGQVMGAGASGGKRSFIWDAANGTRDLGTLGGVESRPEAINEAGQVVGTSNIAGDRERHAFLSTPVPGDPTPPDIEPQIAGQLSGGGWYTSDVVVSWMVSDPDSDVTSTSGCEEATLTVDSNGTALTCTATSAGGTSSRTVVIQRDTAPPYVWASLYRDAGGSPPTLGANGWYVSPALVSWGAGDSGSGLAQLPCTSAAFVADTPPTTITCSQADVAGNVSIQAVEIRVDLTLPTLTCDGRPTFSLLVPGSVFASVSDATSGPAAASVSAPADVSTPGARTAVLSGEDLAGNAATVQCPYDVLDGAVTPPGQDVTVTPVDPNPTDPANPTPVTVTFGDVTSTGATQVTSTATGTPPPLGFKLGSPPTYYDVATEAAYDGYVQVCVRYPESGFKTESKLRLLHRWDPGLCAGRPPGVDPHFNYSSSGWEDTTDAGYPDTTNNLLCGTVTCLSPFTVAEPLEIRGPEAPAPIGAATSFLATAGGEQGATWDFGDGTFASAVRSPDGLWTGQHAYAAAGIYVVKLMLGPAGVLGIAEFRYVVVYDPAAGFVTGGGWIESPPGAYVRAPALAGKASFGFVAKYQKGANVPTGNTQFQFRVADLTFVSETYDWLVVAGAKAKYKGTGLVNGSGPYKFMLTAIDADQNSSDAFTADRFRIVIWNELAANELVVYDNALGSDDEGATTPISGGSIVIHDK